MQREEELFCLESDQALPSLPFSERQRNLVLNWGHHIKRISKIFSDAKDSVILGKASQGRQNRGMLFEQGKNQPPR